MQFRKETAFSDGLIILIHTGPAGLENSIAQMSRLRVTPVTACL